MIAFLTNDVCRGEGSVHEGLASECELTTGGKAGRPALSPQACQWISVCIAFCSCVSPFLSLDHAPTYTHIISSCVNLLLPVLLITFFIASFSSSIALMHPLAPSLFCRSGVGQLLPEFRVHSRGSRDCNKRPKQAKI